VFITLPGTDVKMSTARLVSFTASKHCEVLILGSRSGEARPSGGMKRKRESPEQPVIKPEPAVKQEDGPAAGTNGHHAEEPPLEPPAPTPPAPGPLAATMPAATRLFAALMRGETPKQLAIAQAHALLDVCSALGAIDVVAELPTYLAPLLREAPLPQARRLPRCS
jgi:hypothetical protein